MYLISMKKLCGRKYLITEYKNIELKQPVLPNSWSNPIKL